MGPQYAPVSNLDGLKALADHDVLGNYHLLIAPQILDNDWSYTDFFKKRHPRKFVIVDNGVIELGYPLPADDLARAAMLVGASVVVLPDTIDDARYTVKLSRMAAAAYRVADKRTRLLGVVQGRTFDECVECADRLVKEVGVDWLAVPRGLTANLKTRVLLTWHLANKHGKPLHVLGFSDNLLDDILTASCHPLVAGIDAATPMWAPSALPIYPPMDEPRELALGRRPERFWSNPAAEYAPTNVQRVRRWLSDARAVLTAEAELADLMDLSTPVSLS